MEILNQIWVWVVAVAGLIAGSGIVGLIVAMLPKLITNIVIKKINIKQEKEKGFNEGIAQVKKVTFKHSIKPLVDARLDKIEDDAVEVLQKQNKEIKIQYNNIVNVLDKFLAFFENSLVSEEKKEEMREALEVAKRPVVAEEVIEDGEIVVEDDKLAQNEEKKGKNNIVR